MQVLVRHDGTIHGSEGLSEMTIAVIEKALARHAEHITTVEVHFADQNGHKRGGGDIRCSIEARFAGLKPIGIHHDADDLPIALRVAAETMAHALDHHLGRIRDHSVGGSLR